MSNLRQKLDEFLGLAESAVKQAEVAQKDYEALSEKKQAIERDIKDYQSELVAIKELRSEAISKIKAKESELEHLTNVCMGKITDAEKAKISANEARAKAEKESAEAQKIRSIYEAKNAEINKRQSEAEAMIAKANKMTADYKDMVDAMRIDEREDKARRLTKDAEDIIKQARSEMAQAVELNKQTLQIKDKAEQQAMVNAEVKSNLEALRAGLEADRKALNAEREGLEKLRQDVESLELKVKKLIKEKELSQLLGVK